MPSHVVGPDKNGPAWKAKIGTNVAWKPDNGALKRTGVLLKSLHDLRRAGKHPKDGESESVSPKNKKKRAKLAGEPSEVAADGTPGTADSSAPAAAAAAEPPPDAAAAAAKASPDAEQPSSSAAAGEAQASAERRGSTAAAGEAEDEDEDEDALAKRKLPCNDPGIEDLPIFSKTLRDLEDTAESLRQLSRELAEQYGLSKDSGGARHPTAVIAVRTLAVVDRKLELVAAVAGRCDAVEACFERRHKLVEAIARGTAEAPAEILGLAGFLKKYVHPGGDPIDADKSDFPAFARSFGLPQSHRCVARFRNLLANFSDFWAVATLEQANARLPVDGIMRLLDVAKSMTGGKKSPAMEEASQAICDAIGEQVLLFAQEMKKKDEFAVSRSETPQVESARRCANDIGEQIRQAVHMGCEASQSSLAEAKSIALELEEACRSRIAQKAQIHAKVMLVKDDKAVEVAGEDKIPQVGFATRSAEAIDEEVKRCIKEGAPKSHEFIQEAEEIAKELRKRDADRKRMLARQERLAKQAADAKAKKG